MLLCTFLFVVLLIIRIFIKYAHTNNQSQVYSILNINPVLFNFNPNIVYTFLGEVTLSTIFGKLESLENQFFEFIVEWRWRKDIHDQQTVPMETSIGMEYLPLDSLNAYHEINNKILTDPDFKFSLVVIYTEFCESFSKYLILLTISFQSKSIYRYMSNRLKLICMREKPFDYFFSIHFCLIFRGKKK